MLNATYMARPGGHSRLAENRFEGLCHGAVQRDPLSLSCLLCEFPRHHEAAFNYAWERRVRRWESERARRHNGAFWHLVWEIYQGFLERNYRCENRLKLETGPAVFWILEMLLSVGVFLRRTMAEYSWIIHVSQILCEASFKNSYFGNLKHIQKWKELHPESVVDLCFRILNFRAAVTNCQNLGGSTTEKYCLTVLKGRRWRCKCLGRASSGGAKKERLQAPHLTDGGLSIPWLKMASSCVFLLLVSVFKFPLHQHMPYWTRLYQVIASLHGNSAPVVWEWVLSTLAGATNSCTLSFFLQLALAGVC